jgi:hypothetical protein
MRVCKVCSKNKTPKNRTVCFTCLSRQQRAKDPVRYVWSYLRSNAKRRGVHFALPLDWFRDFVAQNGYMEGKGRTAQSLSFDRRDSRKGYIPGNVRVITIAENSRRVAELNRLHPPYKEIHVPF